MIAKPHWALSLTLLERSSTADRILHTTTSLSIMAVLTQGLPVFFVPEEHLIASMWNDMVDDSSRRELSDLHAANTKGVLP